MQTNNKKQKIDRMNRKAKAAAVLGTICLTGALMTGCQTGEVLAYTEAEIVEKAIEENSMPLSYYAEADMKLFNGDELTQTMKLKEWHDAQKGNYRTEVESEGSTSISVNDGEQVIVYDEQQNSAYKMDAAVSAEMPLSQKDKIVSQFERMRNTHSIEMVGQEQWLGENVYHIKAEPLEDKKETLVGVQEYWINSKNWMIVKSSASSGDTRTEFAYTKIDESPVFDAGTFEIQIPEEAEMISMDEMGPKPVTLEEAETAIGQPFLQFPQGEFQQTEITLYEASGELQRNEVSLSYMENDRTPISLSVFESPGDAGESEPGEKVKVRASTGYYVSEIGSLTWDEDGLRYSLMGGLTDQPDLDRLLKWADMLELVK